MLPVVTHCAYWFTIRARWSDLTTQWAHTGLPEVLPLHTVVQGADPGFTVPAIRCHRNECHVKQGKIECEGQGKGAAVHNFD